MTSSGATFTALTRIITHIPVRVSPTPRRQATPAVVQASNGVTIRTTRRNSVALVADCPSRFRARIRLGRGELADDQGDRSQDQGQAHRLLAGPVRRPRAPPPRSNRATRAVAPTEMIVIRLPRNQSRYVATVTAARCSSER